MGGGGEGLGVVPQQNLNTRCDFTGSGKQSFYSFILVKKKIVEHRKGGWGASGASPLGSAPALHPTRKYHEDLVEVQRCYYISFRVKV